MSDTTDWLTANSGGTGNPGANFRAIGATVKGTIEGTPRQVTTEFGDRLVIDLIALEGCTATMGPDDAPINAGDGVTLWIKPGAMATAIRTAISTADATGLAEGGTLAVQYEKDGERSKPSYNPPKLYRASYAAPVPTVAIGESLI